VGWFGHVLRKDRNSRNGQRVSSFTLIGRIRGADNNNVCIVQLRFHFGQGHQEICIRAVRSALCTILHEAFNLFHAADIRIGHLAFLHSKLAERTKFRKVYIQELYKTNIPTYMRGVRAWKPLGISVYHIIHSLNLYCMFLRFIYSGMILQCGD
jgi:hypothetical protein